MKIIPLTKESKQELLDTLAMRSTNAFAKQQEAVDAIVRDVRERGDEAVFALTEKFDGVRMTPDTLWVTQEEIDAAYAAIDPELLTVIREAAANIRDFHMRQRRNSWFDTKDGIILGQRVTPIAKVGVYVPGGRAVLSSSVLMNIIPAKVAGVPEIIMVTPPQKEGALNPTSIVAAVEAGVTKIAKVGGAQAIAALAYGTESIPRVDKIVGPGNIYVALAKKAVYGSVGIDSIAGPSEILVLADETATPRFVAADLLSQAEHDVMASAILVTTSAELAENVSREVEKMTQTLSRKETIEASLAAFGRIFVAESMEDAVSAANDIASEHVEILTKDPWETMSHIQNAGAIFLGEYSSEPLGDYFAGPDHILPTNGTARFFSPLSVDEFIKKSSVICYSRDALRPVYRKVTTFAEAEGLTAHANSIYVRFENEK
ncbi:MAG: histidinol dehydrogenase [Lachnospiraceae bacterium]|nr:histidinol dehydrogenase [Lachnospiraceae bacterium]